MFGLGVLAVIVRGATEAFDVRDAGLCIAAPDNSYSLEGRTEDGTRVLVVSTPDGPMMMLRIGSDFQLDRPVVDFARDQPGTFMPLATDPAQFVASDPLDHSRLVHVSFERADHAERDRLLTSVRFCPEADLGPE